MKVENKAIQMGQEIKETEEKYFFPDINGKAVTVTAKTREEAEKKANELTK